MRRPSSITACGKRTWLDRIDCITWLIVLPCHQGQPAQTRTNQAWTFSFAANAHSFIVLRVGYLHLFHGVYLQLTIPHISVYSFQTVSHMCRVPPSPSDRQWPFHRDMPPVGGFEAVRYKRNLPLRGPSGLAILGGVTALCAYGFYRVGKGNIEKRYVLAKEVRMCQTVSVLRNGKRVK
jgi:hypothetical protein